MRGIGRQKRTWMEDIRNDIGFDKLNFDIVYDRVECGLKIHVPDPILV